MKGKLPPTILTRRPTRSGPCGHCITYSLQDHPESAFKTKSKPFRTTLPPKDAISFQDHLQRKEGGASTPRSETNHSPKKATGESIKTNMHDKVFQDHPDRRQSDAPAPRQGRDKNPTEAALHLSGPLTNKETRLSFRTIQNKGKGVPPPLDLPTSTATKTATLASPQGGKKDLSLAKLSGPLIRCLSGPSCHTPASKTV